MNYLSFLIAALVIAACNNQPSVQGKQEPDSSGKAESTM